MKKISTIMSGCALMATALMFTGCDSRQKLSENLAGIWSGSPEQLTSSSATSATMTRAMQFTPTGQKGEGDVTLTAYITVENTLPPNDSIVTPITISASGVATITGHYQAKDDDELLVNLNAASFNVEVDPDGVQLNYDILSGGSASQVEALRPGALRLAQQQIEQAARNTFFNITEIDDISIHNGMMKCEISHRDLTFHSDMRSSQGN